MAITMYQYRYIPKNVEITLDRNYRFDDGTVVYLNIVHDMFNRRAPIIQLGLEMTTDIIDLMYNCTSPRLKFDLYEVQLDGDDNIMSTKLYMRKTFDILPVYPRTNYLTVSNTITERTVDQMKSVQLFDMYLYDQSVINQMNQQLSFIASDVSYAAALQLLFIERYIPAGFVIATPPERSGKISSVVLPLNDLISNINKLNSQYGLYNANPIVYCDYINLYCINFVRPNITIPSVTDYGNITFILKNPNQSEYKITGSGMDANTKTYYINLNSEPSISNPTIADTVSKTSTITTVDKNGDVDKVTIDDKASAASYVFATNAYTSDQIMHDIMRGHSVTVTAYNNCVSFIKPYKSYKFDVDSMYLNLDLTGHEYRLSGWSISIQREAANRYIHHTDISLFKPER